MRKSWLTVVVLALGAGGARAGEFASDQLLPPLSQPLPPPRAVQGQTPAAQAPPAAPATGQVGCGAGCSSCAPHGRGSKLWAWLSYHPLQRGACKHGCHGCCARTPPLYAYFLPPCMPCVEGGVPALCGKCSACGRACATNGGFGQPTGARGLGFGA